MEDASAERPQATHSVQANDGDANTAASTDVDEPGFVSRAAYNLLVASCICVVAVVVILLTGTGSAPLDAFLRVVKPTDVNGPPLFDHSLKRSSGRVPGSPTDANDVVEQFFARAGHFRCPQERYFSKKEVAAHKTSDDLWVVIDGNVLDVSMFISQHPGGALLLEGAGGEDEAALFSQYHHPSSVNLFSSFCIGRIRPE